MNKIFFTLLASLAVTQADPQLTSWFTANSGIYARIYQSTANETAGTGTQSTPTYADVSEVNYSATSTTPTITSITATPASPTSADSVFVTASIAPPAGRTISQAQLTYNNGSTTPTTVFNETMAAAAVSPWTGTNANYAWTVVAPAGAGGPTPPNPFSQTAAANHTAVGSGNQFGLEVSGGPPLAAIGDGSVTATNNINATGTSGTVEFYLAATNQTATTGWRFQTSTDGTTWTTRLSESNVNHATHVPFTYTLSAAERISTLKLRFNTAGGGGGGTGIVRIDDVKVTVGATSTPVTVSMFDDGAHEDGAAGDGVYGVSIPAQATNTTVSYVILATDSAAASTTSASNTYTVSAAAPVLVVTPATGLTSSGNAGGPIAPSSGTYTLTNSGNASMIWAATKTAAWLSLSSSGGTLAAGANTTVTATINSAANSLSVANYSDTITFANSTNGTGNTTRAVSLAVSSNTIPSAPTFTALPVYSQGGSKSVSWAAVFGATSYTLQVDTDAGFTTNVVSQIVTSPTGSFADLTSGVTYFYRVLATNGNGSSAYSNVVSSTQDSVAPTVAITSPASAVSQAATTITVTGTSSDAVSGISKVTVNGATATTADGFANWSVSVPLGYGTNGITAVAYDVAGNVTTTAPVNVTLTVAQTYNPLIIPEVMTGFTFNLNLHQTAKRFGNTAFQNTADTTTYSYNNMLFWGPTLIMNKGDWVQLNVSNNLSATTTTHWHGFHIPAVMDGGPHQTIPAGTTWHPTFKVDNNAGTYWYHPHLHEYTQDQLTHGGGGMIIIRDPVETALNLPRTYGVDDIPLALTSRRIASNQFVTGVAGVTTSAYGDYMVVNGTLSPQVTLPRQYVRLRILNAEIERSYNLGFSDGRTFYQIGTDGGLVNAPVALTRVILGVGERAEILVDLTGATVGSTLDLQSFNSGQSNDYPGGEAAQSGQFGSLLNGKTFDILHINVGAATANAVTTRPTTLTTNTFYGLTDVTNTRTVAITGGIPNSSTPLFSFDNLGYSPSVINQNLNLNAVERWNITNSSGFSHSFHIHDIQFHLISRTGGNNTGVHAYEEGWKDVLFIGQNQTVSFIAKFDGFASDTNPFMYHCHFSNHEDEGLMGQFIVKNNAVEDLAVSSFTRNGSSGLIQLDFKATPGTTYTLQYLMDLTTGTWSDIGSVTSDGASATFTDTDATRLGQPRGFYRVIIPKIP
ncbi:MAG: multicopper oxidase domain-containing protein [Luteolibacter sp.]